MSTLHIGLPDLESNWPYLFFKRCTYGLRLFSQLYSQPLTDIQVNSALYRFKEITVDYEGIRLGCKGSRSPTSSIVMASWYPHLFCEAGGEGETTARREASSD